MSESVMQTISLILNTNVCDSFNWTTPVLSQMLSSEILCHMYQGLLQLADLRAYTDNRKHWVCKTQASATISSNCLGKWLKLLSQVSIVSTCFIVWKTDITVLLHTFFMTVSITYRCTPYWFWFVCLAVKLRLIAEVEFQSFLNKLQLD